MFDLDVSIHARVMVRPSVTIVSNLTLHVSIHARVMVRRGIIPYFFLLNRFNPRTRDGATRLPQIASLGADVSIHARVMVRPPATLERHRLPVSIHARVMVRLLKDGNSRKV